MIITVVSGSHRRPSMSRKVSDWMAGRLSAVWGDDVDVVDLAEADLPMWDEEVWDKTDRWREAFDPIGDRLQASDAVVLVTPEWSGMATPAMKNFLLLANNDHVAHKASLLVSVSASRGGAYPIAELRGSGYKNNHLCHIPEHVIVRDVGDVLNGDEPAGAGDSYIRKRIDYALGMLRVYGEALQQVRDSGLVDHETYPYGM